MVGGGRGKPGETIRPAARRVEPEQRSDTESGTVTIHHRPTDGAKCQGKDRESDDSVCNVHGCPSTIFILHIG